MINFTLNDFEMRLFSKININVYVK